MEMRKVTEIDRCIMTLRKQARENMILADELEAKHCQVVTRSQKRQSMKSLIKSMQAKERSAEG